MASRPDGRPADGGPWECPFCGGETDTNYRCTNTGCGMDLTGEELIEV